MSSNNGSFSSSTHKFERIRNFILYFFCCGFCCFSKSKKDEEDEEKEYKFHASSQKEDTASRLWKNVNHSSYFSRDIPTKAIKKIDEENKQFAKILRKKGHRCVYIYETIPTKLTWCESDVCKGRNYFL